MPWNSSVSLNRFVWAIQLDMCVGIGSRSDCGRAALYIWLRKLDLSVSGSESGAPAASLDEQMLDWLVALVRGGVIPKGVLLWFFRSLGIYYMYS